jgi:hypothetical protein
MESKLINLKTAAEMLNRHPGTVRNMAKRGMLPCVMLNDRRYFDQAVIARLRAQANPMDDPATPENEKQRWWQKLNLLGI